VYFQRGGPKPRKPRKIDFWGGGQNVSRTPKSVLIISVTGLPLEHPHGWSKPGPPSQLVSVAVLQFWGGGLETSPGTQQDYYGPKTRCRPPQKTCVFRVSPKNVQKSVTFRNCEISQNFHKFCKNFLFLKKFPTLMKNFLVD